MELVPQTFTEGCVMGFLVAAPIGPIWILCVQRTLSHGKRIGIASGIGSAVSLGVYGVLGVSGVSWILDVAPGQESIFMSIAATVLCVVGFKILVSEPKDLMKVETCASVWHAGFSCFALQMINPLCITIFAGLFAVLDYEPPSSGIDLMFIGTGVFTASMLWWIALCVFADFLRNRIQAFALLWLNRLSGTIIVLFGLEPFIEILLRSYLPPF